MKKEIKALKEYFLGREEISAAFLFGSQAKKTCGRISDWDIAVYFRPRDNLTVEWEETENVYPQESRIWDDLVSILGSENIDLVILNRAPSNIAASVLAEGIPLAIKDRNIFLDFMLLTMRQAEDYAVFVNDYYGVLQRSASLGPRDKEKLQKIIAFLEQEVSAYDYFAAFGFADYQDAHKRRDIERWVENMINSAIDIGEIILASEKKKIPDYYRDVFAQLGLLPQFSALDVEKFTNWVKLRNILAHEYLDIKWRKISDFVMNSRMHFGIFLKDAKKFLG